jgi:hypothetical protein
MQKLCLIIGLLAVLTLSGCNEPQHGRPIKQWQPTSLHEFTLKDGTKCVAAGWSNQGVVSCNWKGSDHG